MWDLRLTSPSRSSRSMGERLVSRPQVGTEFLGEQKEPDRIKARARKMVLRRLELREHTNSELFLYLTSHEVPAHVAAQLLDQCRAVGLVDDARFSHAWVESRGCSGRRSARALRAELRDRGIATDVIEEALQSYTPSKELDGARLFAATKYRSAAGRDRVRILRSVSGALGRRGYPISVCNQVAQETAERLLAALPLEDAECRDAIQELDDSSACL